MDLVQFRNVLLIRLISFQALNVSVVLADGEDVFLLKGGVEINLPQKPREPRVEQTFQPGIRWAKNRIYNLFGKENKVPRLD